VHEAVATDFPDMSRHEVYACGNPLMVDAARHTFVRGNRLAPENFFSDAFITRKEESAAEKKASDASRESANEAVVIQVHAGFLVPAVKHRDQQHRFEPLKLQRIEFAALPAVSAIGRYVRVERGRRARQKER